MIEASHDFHQLITLFTRCSSIPLLFFIEATLMMCFVYSGSSYSQLSQAMMVVRLYHCSCEILNEINSPLPLCFPLFLSG